MVKKVKLKKWGNSFAVRIPAQVVKQVGLREGGEVILEVKEGEIVMKLRDELEDLVEKITDENAHREVDWGEREGKEIW